MTVETTHAGDRSWRPAWKWGKKEPLLYGRYVTGSLLHICSGSADMGDIKVDLVHPYADVKADGQHLPFKSQSWDTIICDPPWVNGLEFRILKELDRVARYRVLFITFNDIVLPVKRWKLNALWVINSRGGTSMCKLFYVWERIHNHQLEEYM